MTMRLIKCYIDNYKGIDSTQIIEFEKDGLTLFDGPNGYGKTTIFETIELCLRGNLHKTEVRKGVTEDRSDYRKAFYQNDVAKDVILKVHFQNESEQDLVIIKHLPADSEGKVGTERAFKPLDSLKDEIFKTYRGEVTNFDTDEDFSSLTRISQDEINRFFYPNEDSIHLPRTFLLFNYLQQEENIFFLKQSEHSKREQLNFLFKTEEESTKLAEISDFLKPMRSIKSDIETQLEKLKSQQKDLDNVQYESLFGSIELDFDEESPYEDIPLNEIDGLHKRLLKKLDDLKEFIQNFDVDEYKKSIKRGKLNEYQQNEDLLLVFILSKYKTDDEFDRLEKLKEKNDRYSDFLESEKKVEKTGGFLEEFNFDEDSIDEFLRQKEKLDSLETEAGNLVSIINDLNDLRDRLFKEYLALREHKHEGDDEIANCPLCGTKFESIPQLQDSIDKKRENLISAHRQKISEIAEIKDLLKESFIKPIQEKIKEILSKPENRFDEKFYKKVKELREYEEFLEELKSFLTSNEYQLEEFKISELKTYDELEEILERLKNKFSELIENITIEQIKLKNSRLFASYFNEDEEFLESFGVDKLEKKEKYLESEYYTRKLSFSQKLKERLNSVESIIEDYEDIQKIYDDEIRDYKKRMIDKVQIPFYLISGKVLKHYPQGMGIFIRFNESNNSIRFLANNDSNHDVVHHLSSGQLAVVSIAFCLALNKVYKISEQFKFLAIDDPVQTMDDINIHSMIELMRHGFKNYQILMSTHEDDVSRYINYKFKKFNFDVKRINVQEEFYS